MSRNRLAIVVVIAVAAVAILATLVTSTDEDGAPGPGMQEAQQSDAEGNGAAPESTGDEAAEDAAEDRPPDADGGLPEAEATAEVSGGEQAAGEDPELQREAETFVRELTGSSNEPLAVEQLDTFVTPDRPLSADAVQPGMDEAAASASPMESEDRGAAEAVVDAGGTDTAADAGGPEAAAVQAGQAAEAGGASAAAAPEPAGTRDASADEAAQPLVDLPISEDAPVTIAEILGAEEVDSSDAVFYVHTVQPDDDQGIWGIIHDGIIRNFAEGIAMRQGETTRTYRIEIPRDADEIEESDNSSSFLGELIYDKSQRSWVYNFETERVGKNPHMIMPGQEIVIVSFSPEELIEIYKHFVRQQEGD